MELITQPQDASEPLTVSNAKLTDRHISLLWERMTMIYGQRWVSNYGSKDDGTWLTGLADISPDQIGRGLEKCRISDDEWVPTLPMFRQRCLTKEYSAPYHKPFPKLESPVGNKEIGEQALTKMRGLLKK